MRDTSRLWLHGLLDLCILGLLGEQRDYGLGLTHRLAAAGLGSVPGGTLYPALLRLDTTGLICSSREPSASGPPRRYFELTDEGRRVLDERRSEWQQFSRSIHGVLGTGALA